MGEFVASLEDAVLKAFARGVDVERSWLIESPLADAPGWLVEVTKVEANRESDYEASLIDD